MASPTPKTIQSILDSFLTGNEGQPSSNKKEEYFQRLKTFTCLCWANKPEDVAAVQCARFGWSNTDLDVLRCETCKAILSGQLPSRSQREAHQEAVNRLREQLATGHHQFCSWTTSQCPENFTKPWLWSKKEAQTLYAEAVATYQLISNELCLLPISPVKHFENVDLKLLTHVAQGNEKAILLSALGWRCGNATPEVHTLRCDLCIREIGIWRYLPQNEDEETSREKGELKEISFHPEAEHLPWCPWVKIVCDKNDGLGSAPGWVAFIRKLMLQSSDSPEQKGIALKRECMFDTKQQQIQRIRSLLT